MELKWAQRSGGGGGALGFNRTFMELKLWIMTCHELRLLVLIVPLWN